MLSKYATSYQGICTGDFPRFGRTFWELSRITQSWKLQQSTVADTVPYDGLHFAFLWENGAGRFREYLNARLGEGGHGAWVRGLDAWGAVGVTISQTGKLSASLYQGCAFDNNAAVIVPNNPQHLGAIWEFCSSASFSSSVREMDQSLKVTNQTLLKVSFDFDQWEAAAVQKYPDGLPEPESDGPTQWLFHGRPESSESPIKGISAPLHVAVARLSGYRWPAELDESMRLSDCARGLVRRCGELDDFVDDDGILPVPALRGEPPLAERLTELLAAAYGGAQGGWSPDVMHKLLADAGVKSGASLDDWLRNAFFEQHCKLFHHRPFVWQVWDGRRDGFSALVNYHKLNHKLLETLTYSYVGDWITTQAADAKSGKTGADLRLAAAQELQQKLALILTGEPPYDIFVRRKPLAEQPIGWNPDLNDGVRMNIRPFVTAGVLRKNPNINWKKDRGTDPESAPWYKVFKGERINDHHLTVEEKTKAQEKAAGKNEGKDLR